MARKVQGAEGNALVAVHECVTLTQALPRCGRLFDQVGIIASLWAKQRGLQKAGVAQAGRTAVAFDQISMNGECVGKRLIVSHRASLLYSSPYRSWPRS